MQLVFGFPLAYVLAFRAGRWELPVILLLVLADELNPIVRIYAYRVVLGREGIINRGLEAVGLVSRAHPISWLLFDNFAVVVVLSTSYITYTVIPIYAAMKAIDASLIEASTDLGAGWLRRTTRILIPLVGARHLRGHHPRLPAALHGVRDTDPGRRHRLVHARPAERRADHRVGRPRPGSGAERAAAGGDRPDGRRRPTTWGG